MANKLDELYNPEKFKEFGDELIALITAHLKASHHEEIEVNKWSAPEEQLAYWQTYELKNDNPNALFKAIIERSIHVHHPKYIGHQISPTAPLAALAGLLSAILNNGMAVYEMGAAATAIEKVVIDTIAEKIGYNENADGFITSGGSLANLTALLAAKQSLEPSIPVEKLGVMVSSEAHYSTEKALRIMGIRDEQIIKIPINEQFHMQTELLDSYYENAVSRGLHIFAVIGSAPSTSTGMHDDLQQIAAFCSKKNIWFHVDGAHGGAAVFSSKYKPLLKGIEYADSITIDGHKMLLMPSIMSFLMFKNRQHSYAAFQQKAVYLWEKANEEDWYDLAKRTFECTKSMMSIQFYVLLKYYGVEIFDQFVTRLYDLGRIFSEKINSRKKFQLFLTPQSNIVCFRYFLDEEDDVRLNQLNNEIRAELLHTGNFYIVQTTLINTVYLRVTFMNPKTNEQTMDELLDAIETIGASKNRC
ncbi:pyridoxal phosphate-dependent decarboxylase family protein [Peijinzhouia sedimentorum]